MSHSFKSARGKSEPPMATADHRRRVERSQAGDWPARAGRRELGYELPHSLWSGGKALISIFSLLVVTPIVAFYLIKNWKGIVATLDRSIPAAYRDAARALARDIDDTIAAFLRGRGRSALFLRCIMLWR